MITHDNLDHEKIAELLRKLCIAIAPNPEWKKAASLVCETIEMGIVPPDLILDFLTENLRKLAEGAAGSALDLAETLKNAGEQEVLDDQLRLVEDLKRAAVKLGEP